PGISSVGSNTACATCGTRASRQSAGSETISWSARSSSCQFSFSCASSTGGNPEDMNHQLSRRLFLAGSGTTLLLAGCSLTSTLAPIESGTSAEMTDQALPLVNKVRGRQGQSGLFNDPVAANAARDHAIRMARHGKLRHDLGSDRTFLARMKRLEVPL